MLMMPKKEDTVEADPALFADEKVAVKEKAASEMTPAEKIENSMIISMLTGAFGIAYIVKYFMDGGSLGLDSVNMIFLFLGIILHKTPANYLP